MREPEAVIKEEEEESKSTSEDVLADVNMDMFDGRENKGGEGEKGECVEGVESCHTAFLLVYSESTVKHCKVKNCHYTEKPTHTSVTCYGNLLQQADQTAIKANLLQFCPYLSKL